MEAKLGLIARITIYLQKNGVHVLSEGLVNFILPFMIYNYAEAPLGDVRALLASSAPPMVWSSGRVRAPPPGRRTVPASGVRYRAVAACH